MDTLAFIAAMTKALAWPAVVVAAFYIWRRQLPDLLERALEFTFPGGSIKFATKLNEAKNLSREITGEIRAVEAPDTADMTAARGGSFVELAYHAPELAVLEAFREVEEALRNEYQRIFLNATRHDLHTMLKAFGKRQVLEPEVGELFRKLMELRNSSAHGKSGRISPREALEYRALCQQFLEAMRAGLARFTDGAQLSDSGEGAGQDSP